MTIVDLLDEDEYGEEIEEFDRQVRKYSEAPSMTPYTKSAAHYPPTLENLGVEHLTVMPTDELRRETKETIAVAVSMVNACEFCITVHSSWLQEKFGFTDSELIELASVVAHVSGLNRFETAVLPAGYDPLFDLLTAEEVPLLGEIEDELGVLPDYYRAMANDEEYLEVVWKRHRDYVLSGDIDRIEKEFVSFAVSVANNAPGAVRSHKRTLSEMGATEAEIFEAMEVCEIFQKNNTFTSGIRLELGLWDE